MAELSDKAVAIIIAVIGLIGTGLSSGGVVMWFLNRKEKKEEKRYSTIFEALKILMQNDIVIFNAFRHNHINGESEEQEAKMKEFFLNSFIK